MKGILIKSAIALSLGVTYVPAFAQTEQPAQGQSTDCPAGAECPQGGTQGQQPDAQGGAVQPDGEGAGQGQQGQPTDEQQPETDQGGTEQQQQPDSGTPEQQQQQDQGATESEQPSQPDSEQQPQEGQTDQQQPDQGQTEGQQGGTDQPAEGESQQTQQGQSSGGDVDVTVEQKTEITQIVKEENVEPVDVDFNVTVGAAVPETVELRPLPQRIVKIVPRYKGYRFFVLADGRIVIVEPSSLKVVVILA